MLLDQNNDNDPKEPWDDLVAIIAINILLWWCVIHTINELKEVM